MIKYSFANCNGQPIHINDVTEDSRAQNEYTCLCCGERMIAHLKGNKQRHFKHYNNVEHDLETYLHKTAKEIIKSAYVDALKNGSPVFLEYYVHRICNSCENIFEGTCDYGDAKRDYDLTKAYKHISLEKPHGGFVPDVMLTSDKHPPIFIEVCVTHKCEPEKIASGYRIIEITIENEYDLHRLKNLHFKAYGKGLQRYNFETNTIVSDFCKEYDTGCESVFCVLQVTDKWKYFLGKVVGKQLLETLQWSNNAELLFRRSNRTDDRNAYIEFSSMVTELRDVKGMTLRNCINCRYHSGMAHTEYEGRIYCKLYRSSKNNKHALKCQDFDPYDPFE